MEVRHLRHLFPAATVEFLAHTLCGCPSHPYVASTKILADPKHHDGAVISPYFACACLLAACLLAKPVRSTLAPKEGDKTTRQLQFHQLGDPNPKPRAELGLGLEIVWGSKVESNDVAKGSDEQEFQDLVQPNQHCWCGRTN